MFALAVVAIILWLAQRPDVKNNLGDPVFVAPRAVDLARDIAAGAGPDGRPGPLLFQDLLGGGRDIYLQHIGTDPLHGWLSFEAHPDDEPRRCVVQWAPAANQFRDPCSPRVFPADGTGLEHYATSVNRSKRVVIDLRAPTGLTPSPN
jgi:hypothetical protein